MAGIVKFKIMWVSFFLCIFSGVNAQFNFAKAISDAIKAPMKVLFFNTCIEEPNLGCFNNGPPFFDPPERPISLPPVKKLNIIYRLYTQKNRDEEYHLEPTLESVNNSPYDPNDVTIFLIPGLMEDLNEFDVRFTTKTAFLDHGKYNVIILDWKAHNRMPYSQAVANTRAVGAHAAYMIQFLMDKKGIAPESVHLIGHSLGAHIAGYIGERFTPKLGRITGLDPAGPFFHKADAKVALDPTDATLVVIIHTNGADTLMQGLGTNEALGHMDFYPNGGSKQTGCTLANTKGARMFSGKEVNESSRWLDRSCDHERASDLLISSISNINCFLGVLCNSYADFKNGLCPPSESVVAEMGFHSTLIPDLKFPAKFYLRTSDAPPFCIKDGSSP